MGDHDWKVTIHDALLRGTIKCFSIYFLSLIYLLLNQLFKVLKTKSALVCMSTDKHCTSKHIYRTNTQKERVLLHSLSMRPEVGREKKWKLLKICKHMPALPYYSNGVSHTDHCGSRFVITRYTNQIPKGSKNQWDKSEGFPTLCSQLSIRWVHARLVWS